MFFKNSCLGSAERFKKSSSSWNTVDSRPCSQQSHNCVSIEQDIHDRNSQVRLSLKFCYP